jgi:D-serine deaminase-like pyridoxal phosphate-dependent protein
MHNPPTSLIGQSITAIDTPALVIDLDAMERNLRAMQTFAAQNGMRLRPHAKMHKSAALALLQMQAGAVGVCVQKPSEAAALVAAGVTNVYVSNEVISLQKCELLTQLNKVLEAQNGKISIAVDSLLGIQHLAQAMATHGGASCMDVYVEIDVGQARCGVPPGDAALPLVQAIAQHAEATGCLRFAGLQAYHGRAQHLRSVQERRGAIAAVVKDVQRTKACLEAAGFKVPLVTGAGSGSFAYEATSGVFGELQAGSYLFMDADYAVNTPDPVQPRFEHALFVKSQVMSASQAANPRAVLDAGHKSHAIDSGLPKMWAGHNADWVVTQCSDEHAVLQGTHLPGLGSTVWLIPGHCDPTVNLHNHMVGVRGGLAHGVVEQIIRVDARGALT